MLGFVRIAVTTGLTGPPTPAGASQERIVQAAHRAAALGAPHLGLALRQEKALELDGQVVLDGQRQRILERKVEVAGTDQLVDPGGVIEADRAAHPRKPGLRGRRISAWDLWRGRQRAGAQMKTAEY